MTPPRIQTWTSRSGPKLEVFIPFLGKYHRPVSGRCCQTCTPRSWVGDFGVPGCWGVLHLQGFIPFFLPGWILPRGPGRSRVPRRQPPDGGGHAVPGLAGQEGLWVPGSLGVENSSRERRGAPGADLQQQEVGGSGWGHPGRGWPPVLAILLEPSSLHPNTWVLGAPPCPALPLRVQDAASGREPGSGGDEGSQQRCKEEICQILREIQAPLSPLLLRLCHWLLPKLLTRLFLGVQLHRGQLEMVLRAARTPEVPLVFLCSHQSPVDGPLLSFLLLSQGIGLPRVTVSAGTSPRLRSLLQRLGGIFLPSGMAPARSDRDEGLAGAVLDAYVQEVLRSRQPLVLFLEEPSAALRLAEPARRWLLRLLRALRDGTVPDILLVPVGIAYDVAPGRVERDGAPPQPLGVGSCLRAAFQALLGCQHRGCAQVDFSQPFSLREFVDNNLVGPVLTGNRPEQLLLPTILGRSPLDVGTVEASSPSSGSEEEILVTALGLHALSDSRACSAVTAVGITAALLLHRHQEAVLLPRLMWDFSELLEQLLLRGRAVGFSGQLRALVGHSLRLLQPPLRPPRAALGPPEASARARLGRLAGGVRHHLAGEAVGACAIRALLLEVLPILGPPSSLTRIVLSRDELLHKILELLQLLPPTLLGLQPCQPPDCHSLDIVDKLILGGLLEEEEAEGERWGCDVAPRRRFWRGQSLGFFSDDSDSDSEHGVPKQCYKLREPQGFPGFLLFLCRLLSPVLQTYGRAVQFLQRPPWPQPEADYVEALLEFLAEDEDGYPDRSLALSSLQSFKDMGVLEELQTPTGPALQLSQPFQSASNREKLAAFIHQFTQL
ncbi:glycerol-3-phosphate acyltransferase 2, mitochondrial isoform X2 [Pyrgilauda ruficollis]|uniref:glycerol-3-phosphate acyltransferase 2, mitochondrial isoform X2 n=1 Tax=Pyrgilauda ruficollis TaxID=221976 RepID=UPI001B8607B2|nr:glycerol-3-phosphate acyltransferase 2, mitochondrial isoform X2 [Pyrgilauda ruficollis]